MPTIEEYLEGKENKDKQAEPVESRTGRLCLAFSVISLLLGSGLWYTIARSVSLSEASLWLAPVLALVFLVASMYLAIILAPSLIWTVPVLSGTFFSVLVFVPGKVAVGGALLAIILMLLAARRMRQEVGDRVRLKLWRVWRSTRMLTILALAILIGAQYFHLIGKYGAEKVLPQVGPNDLVTEYMIKTVGLFNPELILAGQKDTTIDELIMSSLENSEESKFIPGGIKNLSQIQRQQILAEGHKQFSKFLDREVRGDEPASLLMSEMINRKIKNIYKVEYPRGPFTDYVPGIFALAAFLMVISVGSILVPLGALVAIIIFKLLVKSGAVRIEHISVEQEVIA